VVDTEPRDSEPDQRERRHRSERPDEQGGHVVEEAAPREGDPGGDAEPGADDGSGYPVADARPQRGRHRPGGELLGERVPDRHRRRQHVRRLRERYQVPHDHEPDDAGESAEEPPGIVEAEAAAQFVPVELPSGVGGHQSESYTSKSKIASFDSCSSICPLFAANSEKTGVASVISRGQ